MMWDMCNFLIDRWLQVIWLKAKWARKNFKSLNLIFEEKENISVKSKYDLTSNFNQPILRILTDFAAYLVRLSSDYDAADRI
jgi:hypothetical protein